jgi:hypothetical protein
MFVARSSDLDFNCGQILRETLGPNWIAGAEDQLIWPMEMFLQSRKLCYVFRLPTQFAG